MADKCSECKYSKEVMYKKGFVDRLYLKLCAKEIPETIIEIFPGSVDEDKWKNCECIKEG